MLVLSRKVGERLVIGDNITVVINRIAGNRVTIGIEAPNDVRIVRGELSPEVEVVQANVETARPAIKIADLGRATDTRGVSLPRLAK
jgi:carbon storage regulator